MRPAIVIGAGVLVLGAVLAIVSRDDGDDRRSLTPEVEVSDDDADLLLLEEDVREVAPFQDATSADVEDLGLFENPDPRGPCGGPRVELPVDGLTGRAFTAARGSVVALIRVSDAAAEEFLASAVADVRLDCGPYESTTNTGQTQYVSSIELIDLADLGAPALAWSAKISVESQVAFAAVIVIDTGDHLIFVQAVSISRIREDDLRVLAERALTRATDDTPRSAQRGGLSPA